MRHVRRGSQQRLSKRLWLVNRSAGSMIRELRRLWLYVVRTCYPCLKWACSDAMSARAVFVPNLSLPNLIMS